MKKYDFHKKEQNISWSIHQMKTLIDLIKRQESTSLISYAALEGRMIIERIEFEILVMAVHNSQDIKWQDFIEEYKGIQKVNAKYKALKFRYQTFTEAFSRVIIDEFSIKPFDFKKAEEIQSSLNQYIHIYTRSDEDLKYEGRFIQDGIKLIEESIHYLENLFTYHEGSYVFGVLDFSSLKNGFEIEFDRWLKTLDEDIDELTTRLKKIANTIR